MARIVVEGIDKDVLARFSMFCSGIGVTRKDLLTRYITRIVNIYSTAREDGSWSVGIPAFVIKGKEKEMLYISESDIEDDDDVYVSIH